MAREFNPEPIPPVDETVSDILAILDSIEKHTERIANAVEKMSGLLEENK